MAPDEISREVRARLEWGHPESRIRSELLRAGADPATLNEMLRSHLRTSNAEYRGKGLAGLLAGLGTVLGGLSDRIADAAE